MRFTFLVFTLFLSVLLTAQQEHTVAPQETVYGLSKQYGISQEELKQANPFLYERELSIGDVLIIPKGNQAKATTTIPVQEKLILQDDANYHYIEIQPKQTLYSITKEYGVSEAQLISLNPQLKEGLKAGDVLRIPKKQSNDGSISVPDGMHLVQAGETVYSLSRQYNMSQAELYAINPDVQVEGLKEGSFIKVSKGKNSNKNEAISIQDGFIEHLVLQGETVYSLLRKYGISFDELLKHNPDLIEGLKAGMLLKIPVQDNANIVIVPDKIKRIKDNEINIAMMLPFHAQKAGNKNEREISLDIATGAKIALDSIAGYQGKKIFLEVFDIDNTDESIQSLVSEKDFSKYDLVVGPLFVNNIITLSNMLADSGIPIVSLFSNSEELEKTENVIIATPRDEAIADKIINEMIKENHGEKIYILHDEKHSKLAEYTKSKLENSKSTEVILTKNANYLVQKSEDVYETLSDGSKVKQKYYTPIMTVLISENNALGASYVEKLKTMNPDNLKAYGVKYVSSYDIYDTKNAKNIDALKKIGFKFSMTNMVNIYGNAEKEAIAKFEEVYCKAPTKNQFAGFDVVYDLADRMNYSGDLLNNLSSEKARLATKFEYKKIGGVYINQSVRMISLFETTSKSNTEITH